MKKMKQSPIFLDLTMIHGLKKLSANERCRALWRIALLANFLATIFYLVAVKDRYHDGVIITRINGNCKINQVPFPAVSICNYNLVSNKRSEVIKNILKLSNISKTEAEYFLQSLPNLVDYRNPNGRTTDFADIIDILKRHYFTIDTIMEEVHQRCEDLLLYCTFNRKPKNCSNIFSLVKTFEGYCCTFNYAAINDEKIEVVPDYDGDDEFYVDPEMGNERTQIIATSESGRGSGLVAVFSVEPRDYPAWSLTPSFGAKVLVFDPNDFPEYSVLLKRLYTDVSLDVKVQPYVFQAEPSLRSIPKAQRGCAFHDEIQLKHTDRYSTEICNTECKTRGYFKHCGCVPFKYPREAGTRICEFGDLECLNSFRAKQSAEEPCDPLCYLECGDKHYRVTSDVMPLFPDFYPEEIMSKRNVSELSALQVFFNKPTCNCYKQELLMDVTSFIATYGGVFSLSFGASLLTVCEIIYLMIKATIYYFKNTCFISRSNLK